MYSVPPWMKDLGTTEIFSDLPDITSKDDNPEKILSAAIERINSFNMESVIYNDGSVLDGWCNGGAGVVITQGPAEAPTVLENLRKRGYFFTCSYDEEVHALELTLDWLERSNVGDTAVITDSQSLCLALIGDGFELDDLRFRLRSYGHRVIIQWVPGHKDIPGNDLADAIAKEAAEMEGEAFAPTWYHSASSRIRALRKDPPPSHQRTREVYAAFSKEKELEVKSRDDQTLLAKVRSGHTVLFAAYRHRIDETESALCPLCENGDQDLSHWMTECAGTLQKRFELFGPEGYRRLDSLTKFPTEAITLARSTLF